MAGFSIGGKTGTSEKIDVLDQNGQPTLDKIVSFVGVAPMDDPQYIVLVALDTPSRSTGIYISGGVMAAPTVGAVMADILPYLGVDRNYGPEDAQRQELIMPDLTGKTVKEATALLKGMNLIAVCAGTESAVTGQIPAAGQSIPGGSQVLLYFGTPAENESVKVPNFQGMTRQQATDAAGLLGLYILVAGNSEVRSTVVAMDQSISPGTQVPRGTTITLTFTDTDIRD